MQEIWYKGYEDRGERKKEVMNYRNAFESLKEVLEKEFPDEVKADFSQPGWEGQVAHKIGEREAFLRILKIIDLKG